MSRDDVCCTAAQPCEQAERERDAAIQHARSEEERAGKLYAALVDLASGAMSRGDAWAVLRETDPIEPSAPVHCTAAQPCEQTGREPLRDAATHSFGYQLGEQREWRRHPRAIDVLAELVRLKDGPRDAHYRTEKARAWQQARDALAAHNPAIAPACGQPTGNMRQGLPDFHCQRGLGHPGLHEAMTTSGCHMQWGPANSPDWPDDGSLHCPDGEAGC